jgi:hypothetical protein
MASASGFTSMTLLSAGPRRSTDSIRARYVSVSACAVRLPLAIAACNSAIPFSTTSAPDAAVAGWPDGVPGATEAGEAGWPGPSTAPAIAAEPVRRKSRRSITCPP